jgi:glycerol kinase
MHDKKILVIDEGTTSTRAMLFTASGALLGSAQQQLTQYYPADGIVEHDAAEIWSKTLRCTQDMVEQAGGPQAIAGIGITNQRETIVAWDRRTGEPLGRAIVWQDRRTADYCAQLRAAGHEAAIQAKTGLLLDPYFSGSKIRWMLQNRPELAQCGDGLAFGTIESWLIFKLSGGAHIGDASNASRTQLLALTGTDWDAELLALFDIPRRTLPTIVDCAGPLAQTRPELFGTPIAITGAAGDQQAATIGQGCLQPGMTKATFGTGAFILTNSGAQPPTSTHRLLGTVLMQIGGERHYALEGSIFVAGSLIQWLRDSIGLIEHAGESETLAGSVEDNGGVYLVPALSGLGAPHWQANARAQLTGMGFATSRAHIARAALEAMSHQCLDLKTAFAADGSDWQELRVDGGMVTNNWLVQDLADILDIGVTRPEFVETTAMGAAMLAAYGSGLYPSLADAADAMLSPVERFAPAIAEPTKQKRLAGWQDALAQCLAAAAG